MTLLASLCLLLVNAFALLHVGLGQRVTVLPPSTSRKHQAVDTCLNQTGLLECGRVKICLILQLSPPFQNIPQLSLSDGSMS